MERYVVTGYVKMIAINLDSFESTIIEERNTNFIQDIETFQKEYGNEDNIKCMFVHMVGGNYIDFADYKKIRPAIHPFDYMKDLVKTHNGHLLEESDDFTLRISDEHGNFKSVNDVLEVVGENK